jgi:hypothetical protein
MQRDVAVTGSDVPVIRGGVEHMLEDFATLQLGVDTTEQNTSAICNEFEGMRVNIGAIQRGVDGIDTYVQNVECGIKVVEQTTEAIQNSIANEIAAAAKQEAVLRHRRIIHWLSTTDPTLNYYAALKKREPTTGQWLLAHEDFQKWKSNRRSLLWIKGIRELPSPFALICRAIFSTIHTASMPQRVKTDCLSAGCGKTILR